MVVFVFATENMIMEVVGQSLGQNQQQQMCLCLFLLFRDPYPEKTLHCQK